MKSQTVQLALRELRTIYTDRRALIGMGLVGLALGIIGPFYTFGLLNDGLRIIYWLLIAYLTYGAGVVGGVLAARLLPGDTPPFWQRLPVASLGASIPVTLVVVGLNAIFFPDGAFVGWQVLVLWLYCLIVTTVLMGIIEGLVLPAMGQGPARTATDTPAILERVPHGVRGPLVRLATADHYVEVVTTRGKALVLMRMGDAVGETRGTEGMQVHRGHWVAVDAVQAFTRKDGKPVLVLSDGAQVPVSRSHLDAVRKRFG